MMVTFNLRDPAGGTNRYKGKVGLGLYRSHTDYTLYLTRLPT